MTLLTLYLLLLGSVLIFVLVLDFSVPYLLFSLNPTGEEGECKFANFLMKYYKKRFFDRLIKLVLGTYTCSLVAPFEELSEITSKYNKLLNGKTLAFDYSIPGAHTINAGFDKERAPQNIFINIFWAFLIFTRHDSVTEHAFCTTIGHELSHATDFSCKGYFGRNKRFICYVNEIRADYNGILVGANGRRSDGLISMKFKMRNSGVYSCLVSDCTHPSWLKRIRYVQNYSCFNADLIRQIAKDVGCRNQQLIDKVIAHAVRRAITLE